MAKTLNGRSVLLDIWNMHVFLPDIVFQYIPCLFFSLLLRNIWLWTLWISIISCKHVCEAEVPRYTYTFSGEWLISISTVLHVSHTLTGHSLSDTSSFALYHVPDTPTADPGAMLTGDCKWIFHLHCPNWITRHIGFLDKIASSRRFPAIHQSNK